MNNKKLTSSNCFLAEPFNTDTQIGIPNSDFHIYLTFNQNDIDLSAWRI
jgi:hypothetical protein